MVKPQRGFILRASEGFRATLSQDEHDKKRTERTYVRYAGVGMQYGISIALFAWAGIWLDGKFPNLAPLFTLLGLALGFTGATVSLVYQVLEPNRKKKK